jgi:LysM domain
VKKGLAFLIIAVGFLLTINVVYANEIGEAWTGEEIIEETGTNPPPHDEGDREFPEGYEEGYIQHQVKLGDTLWKIAGEYHVDFEDVLELNTHLIDPNLIYPDDLINLPNHQVQGVQDAYYYF